MKPYTVLALRTSTVFLGSQFVKVELTFGFLNQILMNTAFGGILRENFHMEDV